MIEIYTINPDSTKWVNDSAALLADAFPHCYSDRKIALKVVMECLEADRIALIAVESGRAVGFIGARPQYGNTGWELHPLAVSKAYRGMGIGSRLVAALEEAVRNYGGIMIYLGSDDEFRQTSLSDGDLFEDTFDKISNIKNHKQHPYEFYQKQDYKIVGVLPDANGIGKPDIWMAKRIGGIRDEK